MTLPVIFLAVAAIMAGPGELVADCFSQLPRLDAYRSDLIGSLIGIVAFTICAFTGAPPLVWFLLVATLFVVLLAGAGRFVTITLLAAHSGDVRLPACQCDRSLLVALLPGDHLRRVRRQQRDPVADLCQRDPTPATDHGSDPAEAGTVL